MAASVTGCAFLHTCAAPLGVFLKHSNRLTVSLDLYKLCDWLELMSVLCQCADIEEATSLALPSMQMAAVIHKQYR